MNTFFRCNQEYSTKFSTIFQVQVRPYQVPCTKFSTVPRYRIHTVLEYRTMYLVLEYGVHAAHSGTNEDQGTTHAGLRELILANFGMYCSLDEMR